MKDLEPGNDVNNIIDANREAAEKVLKAAENIENEIETEIEDIPDIAREIRSSIEDTTNKILDSPGAPQITKTDVQESGSNIFLNFLKFFQVSLRTGTDL